MTSYLVSLPLVAQVALGVACVAALAFLACWLWLVSDRILPFLGFVWSMLGFCTLLALIGLCGMGLAYQGGPQVPWEGLAPALFLAVFTLPGHAANVWSAHMG